MLLTSGTKFSFFALNMLKPKILLIIFIIRKVYIM